MDAEGSTDVVIDYNKASRCGNFCASVFFNMRGWSISHNQFDGTGAAVGTLGVKNSSNTPKLDMDGHMSANQLACQNAKGACVGVYLEPTMGLVVDSNVMTDSTMAEGGSTPQHTDLTIRGNKMQFTKLTNATAIHLASGINGSHDSILRNEIVAAGSGGDGMGVQLTLSDYNSSCFSNIEGNRITGFRVPISTTSASKNAGVRDHWILKDNVTDRAVQHMGGGPVDVYQP